MNRRDDPAGVGAVGEVDVDHRGYGQVGIGVAAPQPRFEQAHQLGARHRRRAAHVGQRAQHGEDPCGDRVARDRAAIDHLHRQPPGELAFERRRRLARAEAERGGEQGEEQHDRHHPSHRAKAARLVQHAAVGAIGAARAHASPFSVGG